MTSPVPDAYYVRAGEGRYRPTEHTGGAWNDAEQHFSPLGGLIAHAIETHADRRDLLISRIGFDILGRLPREECEIEVEVLRPGRTIELVEARARIGDRIVVRARAWLLISGANRSWIPVPDGPLRMSYATCLSDQAVRRPAWRATSKTVFTRRYWFG